MANRRRFADGGISSINDGLGALTTQHIKMPGAGALPSSAPISNQPQNAQQAGAQPGSKPFIITAPPPPTYTPGMKKGGKVKSRGDGIAQRGKTKGRFV